MFRACFAVFGVAVFLASAGGAQADWLDRTWTNDQGKTINARFIRASSTTAHLNQGGKVVRVPLERLIQSDREWIAAAEDLKKMREWKLSDGTSHRARLLDISGDTLTLEERSEQLTLATDQLNEADRTLIAQVTQVVTPFAAAGTTPSVSRRWTHVNGRSIDAEYRGVEGDKVVLFYQNKEWRIPLADLSELDRQFVAGQHSGAGPHSESIAQGGSSITPPSHAPLSPPRPSGEMTPDDQIAELLRRRRERAAREGRTNPSELSPAFPSVSPSLEPPPTQGGFVWNEPSPPPQIPTYTPPPTYHSSSPSYDEPAMHPTTTMGPEVIICSRCRHQHLASTFKAGDKCRGCGIIIGYIENEDGSVREVSTSYRVGQVRGVIWAGIMIFALLGALIKKIAG